MLWPLLVMLLLMMLVTVATTLLSMMVLLSVLVVLIVTAAAPAKHLSPFYSTEVSFLIFEVLRSFKHFLNELKFFKNSGFK